MTGPSAAAPSDDRRLARSPFKSRVTLATVGLGIAVTLAEIPVGPAAAALGGTIEAPAHIAVQTDDAGMAEVLAQIRRLLSPVFTVRGVYAAPGEVGRRAYGIADMVVPAGAAAAVIGCGLSLLLAAPLTRQIVSIFQGLTAADIGGSVITSRAMTVGVGAALAIGGVFGVLRLLPALRTPIARALRE